MSENPFAIVDAVSSTKVDVVRGAEDPALAEKGINAFVMNRSLSYHQDTLLYVNEINTRGELAPLMQYDFYLHALKRRKRFAKWVKAEKSDDIEAVMAVFDMNQGQAAQAVLCLSREQLDDVRARTLKGGKDKK